MHYGRGHRRRDRINCVRGPVFDRTTSSPFLFERIRTRLSLNHAHIVPHPSLPYNEPSSKGRAFRSLVVSHAMTASILALRSTIIGYLVVVQEFTLLSARTIWNLFRPPFYVRETILQMDRIGVGSLFIVVLTGLFTGMVLALQGASSSNPMGRRSTSSRLISTSVVREHQAGARVAHDCRAGRTGIASEIASMTVTGTNRRLAG